MKKLLSSFLIVIGIAIVTIVINPYEAKSSSGGFTKVDTDCYDDTGAILASSSNCVLGDGRCIDNTCPEGLTEVQPE
ncbi:MULTISPECIES: hypothetical protein [Roseivirga]|uniref:4Fe-4S ferredoxin-type domain-containing protein n=1 Tax=Roseivirga thermotolerans TaxID=1758176 RepID=A0ABQ3IE33_9BACT|nr:MULTISPECIES: hypothetical protein [Roseivirga]MEC7754621.1 hypothetical protein [Bacteroidota bacterium]GHE74588.1 hypothetical protein GCM10011340_34090 [Roseivirga thermotolerans]|tara:strand:+ start:5964 stop:6194 length:231 start_codon:yes stop_codon:yes gene_type:complete